MLGPAKVLLDRASPALDLKEREGHLRAWGVKKAGARGGEGRRVAWPGRASSVLVCGRKAQRWKRSFVSHARLFCSGRGRG